MISVRDLAWTAGFLEGEGSFGFYSRGLRVAAGQVQKEPLERLRRLYGGALYPEARPKNTAIWRWTLGSTNAVGLMMTIYVIMSPRRQAQIRKVLDAWKPRRKWVRAKLKIKLMEQAS